MYVEKLLKIAEKIKSDEQREEFTQAINQCFNYTNTAMMAAIEIEMGSGSISEIERQNAKRNYAHDKLCQAINTINQIAQDKNLEKPFIFELEPMERNGRFAGYSQNNHYATAEISAVIIDELEYLGRETYRNLDNLERLEDSIMQEAARHAFKQKNFEDMMRNMERYNETHYKIDSLLEQYPEKAIEIRFRDPEGSLVFTKQDEYSVDILECTLEGSSDLASYLDNDGTAYDVPISVLRDEVNNRNGYEFVKTVELELECEETLDDVIAAANLQVAQQKSELDIEREDLEL